MLSSELLQPVIELGAKRWVVALSGGLDSTVLLHWLAKELAGCSSVIELTAVHVNHGLQEEAVSWAEHCQRQCDTLRVPLTIETVDVDTQNGDGLEGAARLARYAALEGHIQSHSLLFTAHHADDQAESVLLALMRGSGVDGLAAMPVVRSFSAGHLVRPLLPVAREQLEEYAEAQQLSWIDDPSNQDESLRRNFLRQSVLPLLEQQWPAARKNLYRVAVLQAEQREITEEWAGSHLQRAEADGALSVAYLKSLSDVIQRLVVRLWLRQQNQPLPSQHNWQGLLEVMQADDSKSPVWHYAGGEVHRFQGRLYAVGKVCSPPDGNWSFDSALQCELPEGWGRLQLLEAKKGSPNTLHLRLEDMPNVRITFRQGGEKYLRGGHHRPLKHWLQQRTPPWQRNKIPLLMLQQELLAFGSTVLADTDTAGHCYRIQWQQYPTQNTAY